MTARLRGVLALHQGDFPAERSYMTLIFT